MDGGRLAAQAVLQLSGEIPIRRILVVAGFAKSSRHEAFQESLRNSDRLRDCEIVVTQDGQFDRWISEDITYNLLMESLDKNEPYDVIFCTADSMTLGCLEAIARVPRWNAHSKPRVIGYDGTTTTLNIVDSKRSTLVRIVVQDTKALASAALEQLAWAHHARAGRSKKVMWVEPYLYPRLQKAPG